MVNISVVIPTYRRPELLTRCLQALAGQTLDRSDYEVIVADDAACVDTQKQVEAIRRLTRCPIRYVAVVGRHGPAAARNAGWTRARGSIVAFTDDDTVPHPGWLEQAWNAFRQNPCLHAAAGSTSVPLPSRPTDYERNESNLSRAEFITANCFVRKDVLYEVKGFDPAFRVAWREDSDLHFRLIEQGFRISQLGAARVDHPVRKATWGCCLAQHRKTIYDALLYEKHPELFARRIAPLPPLNYYAAVAFALLTLLAWATGEALVAVIAGSGWLCLTLSLTIRRLRGNSLRPSHVMEMLLTSALLPFVALYYRWIGFFQFRLFPRLKVVHGDATWISHDQ